MQNTDAFERDWRDRGLGRPLHREMTFTKVGLVLGRGTLLAEFGKEGLVPRGLAFDGEEARLLSLLTAAFAAPVTPNIVEKIRRAANFGARAKKRWRKFISPSSGCRRSTSRTPTASSSPGRPSRKGSTRAI